MAWCVTSTANRLRIQADDRDAAPDFLFHYDGDRYCDSSPQRYGHGDRCFDTECHFEFDSDRDGDGYRNTKPDP